MDFKKLLLQKVIMFLTDFCKKLQKQRINREKRIFQTVLIVF